MSDAVTGPLADLIGAHLETTRCRAKYRHDIRRAVSQAQLPAVACYVADEEIYEGRAGKIGHNAGIAIDYYLGPIVEQSMDEAWEAAREATRRIARALILGSHPSWPPAPGVPGTPIRDIIPGLEIIEPTGKTRYGYFHPIEPGRGQSYVGCRATALIRYFETERPASEPLEIVFGQIVVPADPPLAAGVMVEFRPL